MVFLYLEERIMNNIRIVLENEYFATSGLGHSESNIEGSTEVADRIIAFFYFILIFM